MTQLEVTTYYLEMNDPAELKPARMNDADFEIRQSKIPLISLSKFLYAAVGDEWYWFSRRSWTDDQWREYLGRPGMETWIAYKSGTPAGYFEMERQLAENVEFVQLGLLPQFIGQGLGGQMLTLGVRQAWQGGTRRVWLHTCTQDHPHALQHYQARGFKLYREETKTVMMPAKARA